MEPKAALKKIVGEECLSHIKGVVYHLGCKTEMLLKHRPALNTNASNLHVKYILSEPGYHIYRGYYDLDYLGKDMKKFLCHRLPVSASDNQNTSCEIGYYDLETGQFHKITETKTWCWQQGSRLRWHPLMENCILVNSIENNQYCTKVYDIEKKDCINIITKPLYDFTQNFKYGISLNFSRLQRLRPGYGYNFLPDRTKDIHAPEDDGIFQVDIETNVSRLLFSLKDLANAVDPDEEFFHYLNHVCIAPNATHFIFFHIYVDPNRKNWKTVLYVSDIQGRGLMELEKVDRVSHYCWIDENNLMITSIDKNGKERYCTYNILTRKKNILTISGLETDGHPSRVERTDLYVTDTYPLAKSRQKLQEFSIESENAKELASIYHDYRLRGEKRCDLHPVLSAGGKYISVDSTFKGKRRSIVIFEREKRRNQDA